MREGRGDPAEKETLQEIKVESHIHPFCNRKDQINNIEIRNLYFPLQTYELFVGGLYLQQKNEWRQDECFPVTQINDSLCYNCKNCTRN